MVGIDAALFRFSPRLSTLVLLIILTQAISSQGSNLSLFEPIPKTGLAISGLTYGGTWTDLDQDGLPDLVLSRHDSTGPALYKNQGNFQFLPLVPDAPLPGGLKDLHGISICDADGDGDRDMYFCVGADKGQGLGEKQLWYRNDNTSFRNAESLVSLPFEDNVSAL